MTPKNQISSSNQETEVIDGINSSDLRHSISSGKFFSESFDWYFFRYAKPFYERTGLLIFAIAAFFVLIALQEMLKNAFPLTVSKPIFSKAHNYPIKLVKLYPKEGEEGFDPDIKTIDDALMKYLVKKYVDDREGFDFSSADISEVNSKINRIKTHSSDVEFDKFYRFMSEQNPQSPINFFGKKARKIIDIDSVKFVRFKPSGIEKVKRYFRNELPLEAEVKFKATMISVADDGQKLIDAKKYRLRIGYEYEPVKANAESRKESQKTLKFIVRKYDLFILK